MFVLKEVLSSFTICSAQGAAEQYLILMLTQCMKVPLPFPMDKFHRISELVSSFQGSRDFPTIQQGNPRHELFWWFYGELCGFFISCATYLRLDGLINARNWWQKMELNHAFTMVEKLKSSVCCLICILSQLLSKWDTFRKHPKSPNTQTNETLYRGNLHMFGLAYLHLYSGGIITFVFIFTLWNLGLLILQYM